MKNNMEKSKECIGCDINRDENPVIHFEDCPCHKPSVEVKSEDYKDLEFKIDIDLPEPSVTEDLTVAKKEVYSSEETKKLAEEIQDYYFDKGARLAIQDNWWIQDKLKDHSQKPIIEHCDNEDCPECQTKLLDKYKKELKEKVEGEKMIDGGDGLCDTAQTYNAGLDKAIDIIINSN